jgi:hypothetical protein
LASTYGKPFVGDLKINWDSVVYWLCREFDMKPSMKLVPFCFDRAYGLIAEQLC